MSHTEINEEFIKESAKKLYQRGISLKEIESILGFVFVYNGVLSEEKIIKGDFNIKLILSE